MPIIILLGPIVLSIPPLPALYPNKFEFDADAAKPPAPNPIKLELEANAANPPAPNPIKLEYEALWALTPVELPIIFENIVAAVSCPAAYPILILFKGPKSEDGVNNAESTMAKLFPTEYIVVFPTVEYPETEELPVTSKGPVTSNEPDIVIS